MGAHACSKAWTRETHQEFFVVNLMEDSNLRPLKYDKETQALVNRASLRDPKEEVLRV